MDRSVAEGQVQEEEIQAPGPCGNSEDKHPMADGVGRGRPGEGLGEH